jgi:endonuclease/exonuclease/phosphatase family metal-dependent hydrolase
MPRMVLQATIQTAAGPVRVMTTHLEYYSALQRSAQVDALRSIHHEAARHALADRDVETDGGPFQGQVHTPSAILTGDFNFRPDDALYTSIQADIGEGVPRWIDAWTARYPGTPHAHTSGVHDRNQWPEPFTCDFVFASEDLRSRISELRVDGRTQASDHQPILLALN